MVQHDEPREQPGAEGRCAARAPAYAKTLILAHVLIPSMRGFPADALSSASALVDSLRSGTSYRIAEVAIRRWVPARMKA